MKCALSLLIIFLFHLPASGNNNISFKHIWTNQGLLGTQVTSIVKDSQGFMWFSTSWGISKYNGYTIKNYNPNSAISTPNLDNYVGKTQEDKYGNLWMQLRYRYTCFDPRREKFYPAQDILEKKYNIPIDPSLMFIDKEKNIWCYRDNIGTYFYNYKTKKTILIPEMKFSDGSRIVCFSEDKNSVIGIYENGYFQCFNRNNGKRLSSNDFLVKQFNGKESRLVFVDSDNDYWFYSYIDLGIWVFHSDENKWEHCTDKTDSSYRLSCNGIRDIKEDDKKQIWIATGYNGLNIINKKNHSIKYLFHNPFDEKTISQNNISSLYFADDGNMWVGTFKQGVSLYNESIFKFDLDNLNEFNYIKNFSPDANILFEDSKHNIWVGTDNNGLIYIDGKNKEKKIYPHISSSKYAAIDAIVSITESKNGKIWIGTFQNGLGSFDGKKFTHYIKDQKDHNSLINNNVWALAEDMNGYIWIGTLGNGLQCLNPDNDQFFYYPEKGSGFDNDYVSSICVSKNNMIYAATANGITEFSPITKKFQRIIWNKKGNQELSSIVCNQIFEDSRELLWIATQNGINVYNRNSDEIFEPVEELKDKIINAVVEDANKNIWITTNTNICNIIIGTDPTTGKYTFTYHEYSSDDYFPKQRFNARSLISRFDGTIVAGGLQGLSWCNPQNIKYNRNAPKVVFTNLFLFNKEAKIDSTYNGNTILTTPLNYVKELKLNYNQNVFSVSVSTMTYVLPERIKYQYILEGFNNDWITADGNKIMFTNLSPGEYTLKVKAINSDGFVSQEATELKIVIIPPFWATNIAYCFYFIIIIIILFITYKQILRNERQKFKIMRIEEDAKKKHEVDEMKLRFFTNISHDLRTPLTLILSPLEYVIKSCSDSDIKDKLSIAHRNAMQLLNLVNQLLDFRKNEEKCNKLNISQGDIINFIHTVCNLFTEYSEKKNIHMTFFSSCESLYMLFDEDKMSKIITNLLSNAFKFTPENGRVDISLEVKRKDNIELLEIKVSDTGIGISDDNKQRIFEPFYQVQQKENEKYNGSGIGLNIVKEFVILHKGTVEIVDNIGNGTVFIIDLPIIRDRKGNKIEMKKAEEKISQYDEFEIIEDKQGNKEKILIVDDNDDLRLFMRDFLKKDYIVYDAADGDKAWEMIPNLQPNIIISDVMMPGIDGNSLCKLIKNDIRTSHIPVILLTARSTKEQELSGFENGADDYITKPFDLDILFLRIKRLLDQQQSRHKNFSKQIDIAPSEITITSLDEKLINKAIKYIEDNINQDELSVEELSHELCMSRTQLYKKLLSITGKTPSEFIRIIRLKRAAQFLKKSQQNVSEIAYMVGFKDPKQFRKYFKEEFGILPSEFQKENGV